MFRTSLFHHQGLINCCRIKLFYTATIDLLRDDWTVRSKTCRSLMFLKYYCELKDNCVRSLV